MGHLQLDLDDPSFTAIGKEAVEGEDRIRLENRLVGSLLDDSVQGYSYLFWLMLSRMLQRRFASTFFSWRYGDQLFI